MSNGAHPCTVPDVLDAAADQLTEVGRGIELLQNDDGECCLVGALNQVLTGDALDAGFDVAATWRLNRDARAALLDDLFPGWATDLALLSTVGDTTELLTNYNDAREPLDPEADEVISALRRVARQLRQATHIGGA